MKIIKHTPAEMNCLCQYSGSMQITNLMLNIPASFKIMISKRGSESSEYLSEQEVSKSRHFPKCLATKPQRGGVVDFQPKVGANVHGRYINKAF